MQQLKKHYESEKCSSYRPIPFWSWNDKLEVEELKKQVQWMASVGMGGFFMHARSGLKTEYLSDEWMTCIEACSDEAKETDIKAWVYDENGWPSGFVGGKLLAEKENCDKFLMTSIGTYDDNADVSYFLEEDSLVRVNEAKKEGKYLNVFIYTSVCTVDILNPKVVDKFIGMTHEVYKEQFGEAFSDKIEGFFTDEPEYYRWHTSYTDMIREAYWEDFQKDIFDDLGLLFVEKKGYQKFRYWYWKKMQQLLLNNYSKKIYEWCNDNQVKLTGHYVEETTLGFQIMACGGVMPFYEYEHIPGIDWLGKDTTSELAARQVGSVAVQLGKRQVLTETFGCCGWDVTPAELKRVAGFQYVNGVNMMCHHLIPYSERGNRKYDYPAHYSAVNPWVSEEFKTFNDYFTKLGYLLGEREVCVNVAMLHPIRSAYLEYKREGEDFQIQHLEEAFQNAYRTLSRHNVEYHFLDETLLEKYGFVEGTQIGCGKCKYDYLILPPLSTMDKKTEELIHTYIEQGGKVLLLGEKPSYLEGEAYEYPYLKSNCTLQDVIAAQPYRVQELHTEIYSTYGVFAGKKFLYVINASDKQAYTQTFCFEGNTQSFERMDVLRGKTTNVPLRVTLGPGEDALLFLSEKEANVDDKMVSYEFRFSEAEITFKNNALLVDVLRYSTDGVSYSEKWPCPALFQKLLEEQYQGRLFLKYEFEVEEVPASIFLHTEENRDVHAWLNGELLIEKLEHQTQYVNAYDVSAFVQKGTNTYVVEVDWYENPFVHYALFGENVTESLRNCVVYDSELQPIYLFGQFGVYTRTGYEDTEDENFVMGQEFYIGNIPERVTDITTEGFPFLAGEVVLKQEVEFAQSNILLSVAGDYHLAEIRMNGVSVGKILFGEKIDVSEAAVVGKNDITVRFLIGNRNQMGPHHIVGDKSGNVSPWSFELYGQWDENQCECYHEGYDLRRFVKKCHV